MPFFCFRRLIQKYSKKPVYYILESGSYDYSQGGTWKVNAKLETQFKGAIVPFTNQQLSYDENGTYSEEDVKLYTYNDFDKGQKIKHKDLLYTIQEKRNYVDFDEDLNIYFCRRVEN